MYVCPKCSRKLNVPADTIVHCPCDYQGPEPQKEKPTWTKVVELFRKQADQGLGDSFANMVDQLGTEYVSWMMPRLGVDCGCNAGHEHNIRRFNLEYPYNG